MTRPTHAEELLEDLGIEHPNEIDLEAVAFTLGARIRYRPLDGCEALIIGNEDAAVISVNCRSALTRQRFSIGPRKGAAILYLCGELYTFEAPIIFAYQVRELSISEQS